MIIVKKSVKIIVSIIVLLFLVLTLPYLFTIAYCLIMIGLNLPYRINYLQGVIIWYGLLFLRIAVFPFIYDYKKKDIEKK